MATDEIQIESKTTINVTTAKNIKYDDCCLFGDETVQECGPTTRCQFYKLMNWNISFSYQIDQNGWSQECVTFAHLSGYDIRSYLKHNGIISKKEDDNIVVNEKNLVANRLLRKNILVTDSMPICPKHRASFGIDWFNKKTTCHHPEHNTSNRSALKDCRRAHLATCLKIEGFPIGGR